MMVTEKYRKDSEFHTAFRFCMPGYQADINLDVISKKIVLLQH